MTQGYKRCPYCGEEIREEAVICRYCGREQQAPGCSQNPYPHYSPFDRNDAFAESPEGKSRGVAALLAIFLGSLGIHYFYMGKSTAGIIYLLITVLSCGFGATVMGILGLIQGIIMFGMTNQAWRAKYILSTSTVPF